MDRPLRELNVTASSLHQIPVMETRRLVLRPLAMPDAEQVQVLFPHWDVVRLMSATIPWPYPADGALTFIRDVALPAMSRGTEWHWTIRLAAASDRLIGAISLMDKPDDNRGFWLAPAWQGQQLMTEAAAAVTRFWFDTLDRPVLRVPKACDNHPSRRISMREGMRVLRIERRDYVSGPLDSEIWEIDRETWRRRRIATEEA